MKTKFYLLLIAGLLLFALSTAEASIQWGSGQTADQFNYQAWHAGTYLNMSQHLMSGVTTNQQVTNLGGGSGSEGQIATATDSYPGLSMTSSAWGGQLPMGASVSAYTNANLSLDTNQGVYDCSQSALSFINRTLTVNAEGVYILSASASAPINWAGTATSPATASFGNSGAVTLTEYVTAAGGGVTQTNVWSFSLSQLLDPPSPHSIPNITLRPADSSGNAVYYTLNVGITSNPGPGLLAQFKSLDRSYQFMGAINGQFNAGSPAAPITISGWFSVSPNPGPPKAATATAGDAQATVSFQPPDSNGGTAIKGYTVTSNPAGGTDNDAGTTLTTHTVTGLNNGTPYTFTVTATNTSGTGPPSAPSNSVTPGALPGAPKDVTATAGDGTATVNFKPTTDGGASISKYTATSSPGNATGSGAGSPVTVGPLTNGTAYSFTVKAKNAIGEGPASVPSNIVTPFGKPGAPTNVTATAGDGQATVSFGPAAANGSEIKTYTATSNPDGKTGSGTASPIPVSGLTNGTGYTFTVTATNAAGVGTASAPSTAVTPTGPVTGSPPGAPTKVKAKAKSRQATVTFAVPKYKGDSPILSYTATSYPEGKTGSGSSTSIPVGDLTNGTAYTFTVTAANGSGPGPASAPSAPVTPVGPPDPPIGVTASIGTTGATVSFTPPASNGGKSITSYTVTASPGGKKATKNSTSITMTKLSIGTEYTFTVTAKTSAGSSSPAGPSNPVVIVGVPGAPGKPTATAGNGQATVSFPAAAANGSPITSYTVTSKPGGIKVTENSTSIIVPGLTNGTSYTFTVTATNGVGTGKASSASNKVKPLATSSGNGVNFEGGYTQAFVTGLPLETYNVDTQYFGGLEQTCVTIPLTVEGSTEPIAVTQR